MKYIYCNQKSKIEELSKILSIAYANDEDCYFEIKDTFESDKLDDCIVVDKIKMNI